MTTPVRIVRPKATLSETVTTLISNVLTLLIRAWIVMLLAPLVGFYPGYWLTVGLVYGVRTLLTGDSSYKVWTSAK